MFLYREFVWYSPSFQDCDVGVNERTYSHMVVQPIASFLFSNIDESIDIRWDGCQAQPTKQNYENDDQVKHSSHTIKQ